MKNKTIFRQFTLFKPNGAALFALFILIFALSLTARAQDADKPLPTLRGDEAIEQLKQNGQYDSLMEAVKQARGKDVETDDDTNDLAVGQSAKLTASDGSANDDFGNSVAISGDTAVVGAASEDTAPNTDNGAAYVFVRNGTAWTQQAKLLSSDIASGDGFGSSVAISGDTIIIGANLEATAPNTENGAAYVFVRSGTIWTEQAKLLASDRATNDQFGTSVAISGDTIVVGAYVEDTAPNIDNGAAYVFVRSGSVWGQQAKLLASDAASNDYFGISVAISGDTIVVGAFQEDTAPNTDNGAAYVFVRSGATWTQQAKLLSSDAAAGDNFGFSVAIWADTIVVGAYAEGTAPNSNNGAVYVFVRSGSMWTEQAKLLASDPASTDFFGYGVGIYGSTIVASAFQEDTAPNTNNGAAYVFVRNGATWTQQAKLLSSDAAANDQFGYSVAISGANIIVGARFADVGASSNQGSAYVFRVLSGNWTQEARKVASDGASGDELGISVAISGDTAVVGAHLDDFGANFNQGSAYIFVRNGTTWTEQHKIFASDGDADDRFGISVSISGDIVIVGANQDEGGANTFQGSAYIFTRSGTTWTEQQKLTAADGETDDRFGQSVAISGETAVVGALLATAPVGPFINQGAAYVYTRSGGVWSLQQKIFASDAQGIDNFGSSVSISGNTAIVGAFQEDIGANATQGAAYVFTRSGSVWTQQQKLTAADGAANDFFGWSVAISGETAIVSAIFDDVGTNIDQGSAYVFTRSGSVWTQQQKLTAADSAANDRFGIRVAVSGDTAVVGASLDDVGANNDQGSAYVFVRNGSVWTEQQKLTASGGAAGDNFGIGVAISGDKIIVGAPRSDASTSSPLTKLDNFVPQASDQGAVYLFVNTPLPPTAATVSIGGRVMTPKGAGLRNARIYLTDAQGITRSAISSSFGYYRFDNVAAGQTVTISVASKQYQFEPQVLNVTEDVEGLNFFAQMPFGGLKGGR